MILNTPSGAVQLAQPSQVNLPLVPSVIRDLNALPPQAVVQPAAPTNAISERQEKSLTERANTAASARVSTTQTKTELPAPELRNSDTLFLAQIFGADTETTDAAAAATQTAFERAAQAYRNGNSARPFPLILTPKDLEAFSEVKYKPGLKPPAKNDNQKLSIII